MVTFNSFLIWKLSKQIRFFLINTKLLFSKCYIKKKLHPEVLFKAYCRFWSWVGSRFSDNWCIHFLTILCDTILENVTKLLWGRNCEKCRSRGATRNSASVSGEMKLCRIDKGELEVLAPDPLAPSRRFPAFGKTSPYERPGERASSFFMATTVGLELVSPRTPIKPPPYSPWFSHDFTQPFLFLRCPFCTASSFTSPNPYFLKLRACDKAAIAIFLYLLFHCVAICIKSKDIVGT